MPSPKEVLQHLATIDPAGPPRGCAVILRNSTIAEREASIVAAGVHFYYGDKDGADKGDYMAGPVRVDLGSTATAPFRSSDPRRTVSAIIVAVRVRFGEKDSKLAKEFDYSLVVSAKAQLSNPPVHHFLAEVRVEFCVADQIRFSHTTPADWYCLRVVP